MSKEKEINSNKAENRTEETEQKEIPIKTNEYEELIGKYNDLNDRYIRLYADFENYKKQSSKEKLNIARVATRDVVKDFLPIADELENTLKMAEKFAGSVDENMKKFMEGVELILKKINSILEAKGVRAIDTSNKQFDPNIHEAIMIDKKSELPKNSIIAEVQKGYIMDELCLRPARVIVSGKEENKDIATNKTEEENE